MENNEQPWIGIITPTRGMVFTETMQFVEDTRYTYPHVRHFMTWGMPIPDCFNAATERAFADPRIEYLWFLEEDTVPPATTLDKLLAAMQDFDIAACDYGFNGGYNTIARSSINDSILFTGFGCTMMRRSVLEKMPHPFFRADRSFNISSGQWYATDPLRVYGQFDIDFCSRARKEGFTITQVEGECRHLKLEQLGAKEINNGCHIISEKDRISRQLTLPLVDI